MIDKNKLLDKMVRITKLKEEIKVLEKSIKDQKQELLQKLLVDGIPEYYNGYEIYSVTPGPRDSLVIPLKQLKETHPELVKQIEVKSHIRIKQVAFIELSEEDL